jgi:Tn7-like transposition protein D/TniQ
MINFLPLLNKDELLYSVIARYRIMCGMVSKRALVRDIFGKLVSQNSSFFPQHINEFVENLPPTSKVSVHHLVLKHTMFPFYTAFLSEERSQSIFKSMETTCTNRNIENEVGLAGSKIKVGNYLKYCPVCFQTDIKDMGYSMWRRSHQIIGSLYCLKHKVLLKESTVLSTGSGIEYICASNDVCDVTPLKDPYPPIVKELNIKYVENAERLLSTIFPRKELKFIISYYIDRLREKGLASKGGSLFIDELQQQFLHHYPSEYLNLMQSGIDPKKETNWLRLFVRNNDKNRSPLRHLLFLQFLDVEVDEFFKTSTVIGKRITATNRTPIHNVKQRREEWLKLLDQYSRATRSQLKDRGKGLHTWIVAHDWEWYDKVTPKHILKRKRSKVIDWEKRDEECLGWAKEAVVKILNKDGKPTRVTPLNIRRTVGARNWFMNKNLVRTNQYLKEVNEDIDSFRERKIKWAIEEMIKRGDKLTVYKIQLFAGFGGANKEVKQQIENILKEYK